MAFEFRLPDIGEGVVEGEIVKWKVKEGEVLEQDQPMVEVMTDKATVEIPSPRPGKVTQILVGEGKICKVGEVMIVIDDGSNGKRVEAAPTSTPTPSAPTAAQASPKPTTSSPAPRSGDGERVLAAPSTRRLAREMGVDL